MKRLHIVCFMFFVAGIVLGLIQLWCSPWSAELFFKLIVTDSALFVISPGACYLGQGKQGKPEDYQGNGLD